MVRGIINFLLWVGAIAGVAVAIGRYYFFDVAEVGHNGMAPTLLSGEKILLYRKAEVKIGNVLICEHPQGEGYVVGRVAAVGSQTIEAENSTVKVNGETYKRNIRGITEFYDSDTDDSSSVVWGEEYFGDKEHWFFIDKNNPYEIAPMEVPPGYVYLLGDNRASEGQDSRAFDFVDGSTCKLQVVMRLKPMPGLYSQLSHGYFDLIQ